MPGAASFAATGEGPCAVNIAFDDACAILAEDAVPLGVETAPLAGAGGRRLARPVLAGIDSPRRDVAAMDGYALGPPRGADGIFRSLGAIMAGDRAGHSVGPGEAYRVMTGAPVPAGAQRVAMIEYCDVNGADVTVARTSSGKLHIRRAGSDFRAGEILLEAGRLMTPAALVAAAGGDRSDLELWRRPSVAILATGNELAAPGKAAASCNAIPDSLSVAIAEFARLWGGVPQRFARAGDDAAAIALFCRDAEEDVVLILGGASRGDRDFSRTSLLEAGLVPRFSDVAIRPGKPLWYGRLGASHVLGLPGNPTAAMTAARLFLAPLLAGVGGACPADALGWRPMPAAAPVPANGPREAFLCAFAEGNHVRLLERQEASSQGLLPRMTRLARRPANACAAPAGTMLDVLDF
ncbi:molybdopterin molybdotransferase MoeA [Sphingopyxis sp.]|uniref:molybdopterin molybdotransferase MoeA n=1 Tax=Sphingopyxis sp. TaxID=1908224 RepID=UPI002B4A44E8|nr:molybdopterin molybdotransferase MoeA [Sphingopyxis sp.]HJS10537.1 molybdopterin molybdotransferase MoeA [Sphingopyxis sp.]